MQRSYTLDPKIQILKQRFLEEILVININHQSLINDGRLRPPTIRIVKPGTFMEYRRWMVTNKGVNINQVKTPAVVSDTNALEWIAERVVREL